MTLFFKVGTVALGAMVLASAPRGAAAQMPGMPGMAASPFGIPMDRMGSGTTWIPDAVPLPSRHFMLGQWDMMLHGFVFAQYDYQGGTRGDKQFGSLNWGMLMASHALGGGRIQARTMLSLDPATVSNRGYPLLLQSGEAYRGQPIYDRQHPHDFFMELGVLYERAIAGPVGFSVYAAPAGEPALGPVAFMHRPSGMDTPIAPLGHHWQDATHITFGVLGAGLFTRQWKLEGSVFNGREPNEDRWDFDRLRLDSYSGRLTFNPSAHWSITGGYGYLKSPEELHPAESIHRGTASVLYGKRFGERGDLATTLVWGANKSSDVPSMTHSALIESRVVLDQRNTFFGRAEYAQKSAADLAVDTPEFGHSPDERFGVSRVSLGYIRELGQWRGMSFGLGALGTVNVVPGPLERAYGSRTPLGGMVFLRLRPVTVADHTNHMEGTALAAQQTAGNATDSAAVVATTAKFHAALAAGDSTSALALLTDDVQILETGGIENRARYRAGHLRSDIEYAKAVPSERSVDKVTVRGDVAWVVSTSTTTGQYNGRAVNSQGAELMVLTRTAQGWKIAAIHWSSRTRRS